MVQYCKINKVVLQLSKCKFLVINGSDEDRVSVEVDGGQISSVNDVMILGSPLTDSGISQTDLDLHLKERFINVVKFYNFLRANKRAPISVKLKVLSTCVRTLLYNCETFGDKLPEDIKKHYHKLLRCAVNVRGNTPIELVFIETGFLPIKALVEKSQLKFFRRFKESFRHPDSIRRSIFNDLLTEENITGYLNHYSNLDSKYTNPDDIYTEAYEHLKSCVRNKGSDDGKYRFHIYCKINPELIPSPFLNATRYGEAITRFRLGSHHLPIETGRWRRVGRMERLCPKCNVFGDEYHFLFYCTETCRNPAWNFSGELHDLWSNENIFKLFKELVKSEFL